MKPIIKNILSILAIGSVLTPALSIAQTYNIEPSHTYPSFEADHMGISVWRGKFGKTSGTITLDRAAKTGTMDITIDATTVDFGHAAMNEHAKKDDIFNVAKFPTATYKGKSMKFEGDAVISVDGELTLMGKTLPVPLTVRSFKCIQHPRLKREVCGADAVATFNRKDFGLNYASPPFAPEVRLQIQVEALKSE